MLYISSKAMAPRSPTDQHLNSSSLNRYNLSLQNVALYIRHIHFSTRSTITDICTSSS